MNPNRYSFECQRAFLQGLQVATSMGHEWLEIEHVVVFLAEVEGVPLSDEALADLRLVVREHLKGFPKHYSNQKPQMGGRLKTALRRIEDTSGDQKVQPAEVWRAILEDENLAELMRSGPSGVPDLAGAEAGSTEGARSEKAKRSKEERTAEK